MSSVVNRLCKLGLIKPPGFVKSNTHYEVLMGSVSYGCSSDTSDCDVYGFCIPSKDIIFPHLQGVILGYDTQYNQFEQFQQVHIKSENELAGKGREYDITIYNIVKYFKLCADCNPNMIDSLFVPQSSILSISNIGQMVREKRHLFLSKKAWHSFKGYAYSQLHKAKGKNPEEGGKRKELHDKYGMDTKFLYHVARLIDEVQQILELGDVDLQRSKEQMKAIRRGEVPQEEIEKLFQIKEKELEKLYHISTIPYSPRYKEIKELLMNCLEEHYGNLEEVISRPDKYKIMIEDIKRIVDNES